MTWMDSLREAIRRRCERNGTDYVTRKELIEWELPTIIRETGSAGETPEQTLSEKLQKLRNLGEIEFVTPGVYRRK